MMASSGSIAAPSQDQHCGLSRSDCLRPPKVIKISAIGLGRSERIQDCEQGVHSALDCISLPLVPEHVRNQRPCTVLINPGVVDQPMHGVVETGETRTRPPMLLLVLGITKGTQGGQNILTAIRPENLTLTLDMHKQRLPSDPVSTDNENGLPEKIRKAVLPGSGGRI